MEWIVKIEKTLDVENEVLQRIRIQFSPMTDSIFFYGEARVKNNQWHLFSEETHSMYIELDKLQECMEKVVVKMRERLQEYENIAKGFTVLKEVAFKEDTED